MRPWTCAISQQDWAQALWNQQQWKCNAAACYYIWWRVIFFFYCPAFRKSAKGEYDTFTVTAAGQVSDSWLHASRFISWFQLQYKTFQRKHILKVRFDRWILSTLIWPTNSGNRWSPLIKHSDSLRQQQLGFWNNCEDAQDVKGITHRVTPAGREKELHHRSFNNRNPGE